MAKVLLLDGNSLLYRGFFAMRALTTSSGQQTHAVYSLAMMLMLAIEREKPDSIVCAWDAPVATFRHIEYEAYKGTRERAPEELHSQKPFSRELMTAFRVPMLEMPGWEADDILGTLAELAKNAGHDVLIVTGDLDALQLVDDDPGPVRVMTTSRGVTETVVYDEAAVRARFGIEPLQLTDYKGLKGDSSDNLPGVPGIGDKTASKLVAEYGTVENLLAHVADVKNPKLQALLTQYADQALQCKHLATIRRDVPLPEGFSFATDYQSRGVDVDAAKELFERLEFRTLVKRIPGVDFAPNQPPPVGVIAPPPTPQPQLSFDDSDGPASSADTLSTANAQQTLSGGEWANAAGLLIGVTTPLDKTDIMSAQPDAIYVAQPGGVERIAWADISTLRAWLEDEAQPKVVYDLKLITGILLRAGINLRGVKFDVLLAAYLLNAGRSGYKLVDLIHEQIGLTVADGEWPPLTRSLRGLEPIMRQRLEIDGLMRLHDAIELPLASIIARLEVHGVAIDPVWMGEISVRLAREITRLEDDIFALAGGERFTIGSPKQLQVVLFERMALPSGKKTKTGYSTDSEVLEALAGQGFEIAAKILQWRELAKLKSQYADNLPALINPMDGRIHTTLSQTVASTGRLSSSNPNLQNIPIRTEIGREIRRGFVATAGNVLVCCRLLTDPELRIFAHITRDPELMRTFTADEDIHRRTAALVFAVDEAAVTSDQRRRAKTINFAVIYGMGDFRLATELGVDRATAAGWKKRYFANYPGVQQYAEALLESARNQGYVTTLSPGDGATPLTSIRASISSAPLCLGTPRRSTCRCRAPAPMSSNWP